MAAIKPVTVMYVHYPSDLYGAGRSLVRLTSHLDKSDFHPLVVLQKSGPLKDKLEENGIKVLVRHQVMVIERKTYKSWRALFLPFLFFGSVFHLYLLIKRCNVDVVHTNTGIILSSGIASRIAGVPHVWHIRDWFGEFSFLWSFYSRYILWSSAKVVCVSRAIADQFPASPKVIVQNNGFALNEFAIDKRSAAEQFRQLHELNGDFVVGTVGRIKFVRKGQEVLVRAAHMLAAKGVHLKYVIVGSVFPGNEDHLSRLQELIKELHLETDVKLVGEMNDTKPAYASMDVFVLPSGQPEPFGGVVMEAMAMGLPVIGTNIGGTVDQIVDGITGYLIPPNDPIALAERIEIMYRNPTLRQQFSSSAVERIQTIFSLDVMAENMKRLYTDVIREAHS